jgi:hypothetical protein
MVGLLAANLPDSAAPEREICALMTMLVGDLQRPRH